MLMPAIARSQPAPAGVEGECAYLDYVLAFQAANGGPFAGSLELEYAVRRLTRAWVRAGLPQRGLRPWLAFAVTTVCGDSVIPATLARRLDTWAIDECRGVSSLPQPSSVRARRLTPDGDALPGSSERRRCS
jgi:hypothetical protein